MSAFATFAVNGTGFEEKFPGVTTHLLTLSSNFIIPFFREYMLALGLGDVSKESCLYKLRHGHSIAIVVGGARESLVAIEGEHILHLKNRKGFVKIALQTGASLVPVCSGGENRLYSWKYVPEGSRLRKVQDWMREKLGFTIPNFIGRGIFQYDFGLISYRKTIDTVIGAPISVEKVEHPTHEQVDALHSIYIQELTKLFDAYKDKFATDRKTELIIQ